MNMQASSVTVNLAGSAHAGTTGKSWLSVARQGTAQPGVGLRNATGENNCFLNVIIQCLWRCGPFRHAVMQWPKAVYQVRNTAAIVILCAYVCPLCQSVLCHRQCM